MPALFVSFVNAIAESVGHIETELGAFFLGDGEDVGEFVQARFDGGADFFVLVGGLLLGAYDGLAEVDGGAPFIDGEIDEVGAGGGQRKDQNPGEDVATFETERTAENRPGDLVVHISVSFMGMATSKLFHADSTLST